MRALHEITRKAMMADFDRQLRKNPFLNQIMANEQARSSAILNSTPLGQVVAALRDIDLNLHTDICVDPAYNHGLVAEVRSRLLDGKYVKPRIRRKIMRLAWEIRSALPPQIVLIAALGGGVRREEIETAS